MSETIEAVDFLKKDNSLPFEISATELKAFVQQGGFSRPSFYCLTWIERGTGHYTLDFCEHVVQSHRLYILLPGQVHAWQVDEQLKGVTLMFSEEYLRLSQRQNELGQLEFLAYQRNRPYVDVPTHQISEFRRLLEAIRKEDESEELGRNIMIQTLLQQLLIKAERLYADHSLPEHQSLSAASLLNKRFQALIQRQGFKLHSVQVYAEALHVSPKYLSEVVKHETGEPPSIHIRSRIVLEAKRLLAHEAVTAQGVAYELGFDDPAYFGRFFKREAGLTPKQFQKRIRTEYQNI